MQELWQNHAPVDLCISAQSSLVFNFDRSKKRGGFTTNSLIVVTFVFQDPQKAVIRATGDESFGSQVEGGKEEDDLRGMCVPLKKVFLFQFHITTVLLRENNHNQLCNIMKATYCESSI